MRYYFWLFKLPKVENYFLVPLRKTTLVINFTHTYKQIDDINNKNVL